MAGAMRKMAVYLGLVEDDGYDGPGFDPDDVPEDLRNLNGCPFRVEDLRWIAQTGIGVLSSGLKAAAQQAALALSLPAEAAACPDSGGERATRPNRARGIHHT